MQAVLHGDPLQLRLGGAEGGLHPRRRLVVVPAPRARGAGGPLGARHGVLHEQRARQPRPGDGVAHGGRHHRVSAVARRLLAGHVPDLDGRRQPVGGAHQLPAAPVEPERPHEQPPVGTARGDAQLAQRDHGAVGEPDVGGVAHRVAVPRLGAAGQRMDQLPLVDVGAHHAELAVGKPERLASREIRDGHRVGDLAVGIPPQRRGHARAQGRDADPHVAAPRDLGHVVAAKQPLLQPQAPRAQPHVDALRGGGAVRLQRAVLPDPRRARQPQQRRGAAVGKGRGRRRLGALPPHRRVHPHADAHLAPHLAGHLAQLVAFGVGEPRVRRECRREAAGAVPRGRGRRGDRRGAPPGAGADGGHQQQGSGARPAGTAGDAEAGATHGHGLRGKAGAPAPAGCR